MKLPDDKNERTKVLVLVAIGGIAVIFGIIQGVINPMKKYKQEQAGRLVELGDEIEKARRAINRASSDEERNIEAVTRIKEISDRYILHPVLGNFLLGPTRILERDAASAGIVLDSVHEVGISEIVQDPRKKIDNVFKGYTVRVSVACGYTHLAKFLKQVEDGNPYLCMTGMTIIGNPDADPENHAITLDIQWPVWADYEMSAELEKQLQAEGIEDAR